jgi:putative oxidoreductase
MRTSFPFLSQQQALVLLRWSLALVFFLHAIVRIFNGSIPQFAGYMNDRGFVYGTAIVYAITFFEITGSILLALNYQRKYLCAGFIVMLIAGIIIIHAPIGWFAGEHGTGGTEYSFILIVALLAVATSEAH